MRLFIAEKPSVAKAIATELGVTERGDGFLTCGDDIVTWEFGHILEQAMPDHYLPDDIPKSAKGNKIWREDDLPIIPEQWVLLPKPDAKKQLNVILKLLKDPTLSEICNAGDPDREGNLLVDEVITYSGVKKPVKRFWVSAQDPTSIKRGLANMKDNVEYRGFSDAALARSRADWLVGLNLTRAFTLASRRNGGKALLTVGRVQTPTLKLLVDRDRAIENFIPMPYHTIKADIIHANGQFTAEWKPKEDQQGLDSEGRLIDSAIADAIVSKISHQTGTVSEATKESKQAYQPLAYSLSDITVAAAKYGFTAQEVLDTCQSLYETHKLTSYPRTDSGFLPESQHADAPEILVAIAKNRPDLEPFINGADTRIHSKTWNDKEIKAHHGIIPTRATADIAGLSQKEQQIYDLIVRTYIAQFYPPQSYDQSKITVTVNDEKLIANGKVVTSEGWKVLFKAIQTEEDTEQNGDKKTLPMVANSDSVTAGNIKKADLKTKPPALFSEATLIRAMENIHKYVEDKDAKSLLKDGDGIGTSATRAAIISELKRRNFIEPKGKNIISTAAGRALIDVLPESVKSPVMTAVFERTMQDIEQGNAKVNDFIAEQVKYVTQEVTAAKKSTVNIGTSTSASAAAKSRLDTPCPNCGKPIAVRPKLFTCTGCDFKIWSTFCEKTLTVNMVETLIKKGETAELKGFKKKDGTAFSAKLTIDKTTGKIGFPVRKK